MGSSQHQQPHHHHQHAGSPLPEERFPRPKRELSPDTRQFATLTLEKIFTRLAGIEKLTPDFVRKAVKDCGEYLNFAAMAYPHLQSGKQGCVAVFGSSRSKELDAVELRKAFIILSHLTSQNRDFGSPAMTLHRESPKKLNTLKDQIGKYLDKPQELPLELTERLVGILTKLHDSHNPKLRQLVNQTPASLSQLRTQFNMHWGYRKSMDMGASLAKAGFMVMSGGGPGSMEGSCRGANPEQKIDAPVIAVAINIPGEPGNPFIPGHGPGHAELVANDSKLDRRSEHEKFTGRKWGLVHESNGLIVMPGGFGTVEEFLEVLSLIAGGNIDQPVCFVGKRFYQPIVSKLKETGFISKELSEKICVVDSTEEAAARIIDYHQRHNSQDGKIVWPERWANLDDDLSRDLLTKRQPLPQGGYSPVFSFPQRALDSLEPEDQTKVQELLAVAQEEIQSLMENCPHADQLLPKMVTGFAKFLIDSLNVGAKMAELNVEHPVLLLGSQNLPHFMEVRNALNANGVSVVQKIGDTNSGGIGVTIALPGAETGQGSENFEIAIPARNRAVTLDAAASQCNKIFVADGGVKALHRTFQYLCWIQTGKLKNTELVVIDPKGRFMSAFKAVCEQSESFGCTKRDERGFIQIYSSLEEAVAAGHHELKKAA